MVGGGRWNSDDYHDAYDNNDVWDDGDYYEDQKADEDGEDEDDGWDSEDENNYTILRSGTQIPKPFTQ
jgi:hypothetical protein